MVLTELLGGSAQPDSRMLELRQKAKEMARYYCKGLGNTLVTIAGFGADVLKNPENVPVDELYLYFDKIMRFYDNIPFDALQDNEAYAPLFVVRELLPFFKEAMDVVYLQKNERGLKNLTHYDRVIREVGDVYRRNLRALLIEIKKFPEAQDFEVELIDLEGNIWQVPYI